MRNSPLIEDRVKAMADISARGIKTYVTTEPLMEFDLNEMIECIKMCNPEQIEAIEATVNEIINQHLSVTSFFVTRDNVPSDVDLSKLPDDASETLRIVKIGDYDICACIGAHVNNTSEIGKFTIISTDYTEGRFRIRFKLANS